MATSNSQLLYSTTINPKEHGAKVTIAAAYGITCSLMFLGTRLVVRWPLTSLFRWDDAILTLATVRSKPSTSRYVPKILTRLLRRSLLSSKSLSSLQQSIMGWEPFPQFYLKAT
jgi:hypothetical protein